MISLDSLVRTVEWLTALKHRTTEVGWVIVSEIHSLPNIRTVRFKDLNKIRTIGFEDLDTARTYNLKT